MKPTTARFCDDVFEPRLGIPRSTAMHFVQHLRQDETVFRRGKQGAGAIEPTTTEIANWLIALCAATATKRESPDPIATVKFARAAVRLRDSDAEYVQQEAIGDLAIGRANTFGEAIDSLLNDMRAGTYGRWKKDHVASTQIRFVNNGGRIVVSLDRYSPEQGGWSRAAFVFRSDNPADRALDLTYIHELNGTALEALAEILGPLPS